MKIEEEVQAIYHGCSVLHWHSATIVRRVAIVRETFSYKQSLLIGCGLVFFQQVTGQPSVLYFATDVFKDAGFGTWAALSSVGVGFAKLLATLFTVWRVDKSGRRKHLFIGITMMASALSMLGTAFLFQACRVPGKSIKECDEGDVGLPYEWATATALALMLYVSGYQVGFGSIFRLLISEVFPLSVRGAALSLVVVLDFATNIAMTLTQEALLYALTPSGLFLGYCALTLVSMVFVWGIVPETRGKSLEQIQDHLSDQAISFDAKRAQSISSISTRDSFMDY